MSATQQIRIQGGTLVTIEGRRAMDIEVLDGRLATIAEAGTLPGIRPPGGAPASVEVIDATGLYVLPGLIDGHVHLRDPGDGTAEDIGSGTAAAVAGGVTTVLDMPNTDPPTDDAARVDAKLRRADAVAHCDLGVLGLVDDRTLDRLEAMAEAGAVGFKAFLGPTTGGMAPPSESGLRAAMTIIARLGMRLAVHAEDATLVEAATTEVRASGRTDPLVHPDRRPVAAEVAAIDRVGAVAVDTGCAVHVVHLTSADGLAAIERWRARGADITCEVSANHVLLGAEDMAAIGSRMQMNPPVRRRAEGHATALLEGLADGRVTMIASDHAPHPASHKPDDPWVAHSGAVGVETSLQLFLDRVVGAGILTLERLVKATSAAPARVWGLSTRMGALTPGLEANLVLVDPARPWTIDDDTLHGRARLTPFRGWSGQGAPVLTMLRGRVVMRDGEPVGEPIGRGIRPSR
ncbi:MAG: dihydroorotase family protein [Chloroflexi bacterium]|nr:dihydroorotase family protein [Chloroflexota bacterium]